MVEGSIGARDAPTKGFQDVSRQREHFGLNVDTEVMRVFARDKKFSRVRRLARKIMGMGQLKQLPVTIEWVLHFCGVCVSLTLTSPPTRFYMPSVYIDMTIDSLERFGAKPWSPETGTEPNRGSGRSPNRRREPHLWRRNVRVLRAYHRAKNH